MPTLSGSIFAKRGWEAKELRPDWRTRRAVGAVGSGTDDASANHVYPATLRACGGFWVSVGCRVDVGPAVDLGRRGCLDHGRRT